MLSIRVGQLETCVSTVARGQEVPSGSAVGVGTSGVAHIPCHPLPVLVMMPQLWGHVHDKFQKYDSACPAFCQSKNAKKIPDSKTKNVPMWSIAQDRGHESLRARVWLNSTLPW